MTVETQKFHRDNESEANILHTENLMEKVSSSSYQDSSANHQEPMGSSEATLQLNRPSQNR